jgi:ABC-type sugar transport system permease subunit
MVLPAALALGLFQFLPLAVAMLDSLRSFNPFDRSPTGFVGAANYLDLFTDPTFHVALLNTIVYIVLILALSIPLALALAVLIDRGLPGTAWARGSIIATLAASEAVAAIVWNQLYEPSTGLFNSLLAAVHLPPQLFLTGPHQALGSIVLMTVWKDIGVPVLIFLAGLQAIPSELSEAAALDGAGPWRIFVQITLPQLRPSLALALFMMTITATRIFTPIMILTQGGPEGRTANLAQYAYTSNFDYMQPGTAGACVVCLLGLLVILTVVQGRLLRTREDPGS